MYWQNYYKLVTFINSGSLYLCCIIADTEEHDKEGRVIAAEYDDYYVVTACE